MTTPRYQLIGRRWDSPQSLLFRDAEGRHFLRASCGAGLVRITSRDARRLLRRSAYHSVLDTTWRTELEAVGFECTVPWAPEELPLPT